MTALEEAERAGIDSSLIDVSLRPRHRFASPKHSFLDNPEPGVALNTCI
jgi:hypothetical protein